MLIAVYEKKFVVSFIIIFSAYFRSLSVARTARSERHSAREMLVPASGVAAAAAAAAAAAERLSDALTSSGQMSAAAARDAATPSTRHVPPPSSSSSEMLKSRDLRQTVWSQSGASGLISVSVSASRANVSARPGGVISTLICGGHSSGLHVGLDRTTTTNADSIAAVCCCTVTLPACLRQTYYAVCSRAC